MRIQNIINLNINFKSTYRHYINKSGEHIGCYSYLFRDDVDWNNLAKYEEKNFKNKDKVNIIMFASSDGSEAYTKIISLYENLRKDNPKDIKKFFPIMAYDVDSEILKAAQSGFIRTSAMDRVELGINTVDYDDYFELSRKKLEIKDDKKNPDEQILRAKKILTDNVEFNYGDMFEKVKGIEDKSNTIVMCRNILGYFWIDEIEKFIQQLSYKLKADSLFVVGSFDLALDNVKNMIEKYNFKEVMKNVYKKV